MDEQLLATFCFALSDAAFRAWTGESQITPESYREICQVASKFQSANLMIRIAEKFPGMATASHL